MKISMDSKSGINKILSVTLLATIITCIANLLLRFKVNDIEIFVLEGMSILILYMLKYQKRILAAIVVSIVLVLGIFLYVQKVPVLEHINQLFLWFIDFINGDETLHKNYARIILVLIQVLMVLLAKVLQKNRMIRYISSFLALLVILILSVVRYNPSKLTVGFVLLLNLIMFVEIRCNTIDASEEKRETAIFHLIPICLIVVFLVMVMPARHEPVQWTGVRHVIFTLKERGEMLWERIKLYSDGKDGSYEMSLSGYGDGDTRLGGDVELSDSITLKLKTSITDYPGYLIGNVKNVYTGSGWKTKLSKVDTKTPEYMNDFYELICALSRVNKARLEDNDIIKLANYEVIYNDIKTITQFYPLKTYQFIQGAENRLETDKLPNITFRSLKGKKTNYVLYYYILNLDNSVLKELLRNSDVFQYDDYIASYDVNQVKDSVNDIVKFKSINWSVMTKEYIEKLKERRDLIYKEYTQLPEELPQRVIDLAQELTKDQQNNYDKMKAIESYLNSYSYTTKSLPIDKKKDFVDSFLFERKQGYCTYFASAMAVLGRSIGVPTRYIEGFYVDYKHKSDGYYEVNNSNAHAWVEAYFDGVGWIPFEPTPGYVEKRYKQWVPAKKKAQTTQETYDYSEQYKHIGKTDNIPKLTDNSSTQSKSMKPQYIIIFLAVIISMFLLATIYYSYLSIKMRKQFEKSNPSVKGIAIYRKIMFYLEYIGYPYNYCETLCIYTKRIDEIITLEGHTLQNVNDLYMAIHYGDYEITQKELDDIKVYEQELHQYLIRKYGRLKIRRCTRKLTLSYKKLFN